MHDAIREFPKLTAAGLAPDESLDRLQLHRYCCRRFPLTAVTQRGFVSEAQRPAASNVAHQLHVPESR